jgi:hypothetical protein
MFPNDTEFENFHATLAKLITNYEVRNYIMPLKDNY